MNTNCHYFTKELFVIDTHWEIENQFYPVESHWVYPLYFQAGPMLSFGYAVSSFITGINSSNTVNQLAVKGEDKASKKQVTFFCPIFVVCFQNWTSRRSYVFPCQFEAIKEVLQLRIHTEMILIKLTLKLTSVARNQSSLPTLFTDFSTE